MEPTQNNVSRILRGALAKRVKLYKERLVRIGCAEPPEQSENPGAQKMAAAILKARKSNKKKGK